MVKNEHAGVQQNLVRFLSQLLRRDIWYICVYIYVHSPKGLLGTSH